MNLLMWEIQHIKQAPWEFDIHIHECQLHSTLLSEKFPQRQWMKCHSSTFIMHFFNLDINTLMKFHKRKEKQTSFKSSSWALWTVKNSGSYWTISDPSQDSASSLKMQAFPAVCTLQRRPPEARRVGGKTNGSDVTRRRRLDDTRGHH